MKIFKILLFIPLFFLIIYPNVTRVKASLQDEVSIRSEAAILMDSRTGAILYDKNAEKKMYPASLTKIATAIYAIENGQLDDLVTISENSFQTVGTSVFLETGEITKLKKLIQGMLINSGNDAATAIAEHLHGSVEAFAENLNQYLKETVGVKNTHFSNPHGLFAENHYTTAEDLAIMTNYALKNDVFKKIFGTKTLEWDGQSWDTTIITHHLMLKGEIPYEAVTGGKTGYVRESKLTLATTAENESISVTAIVLKADTSTIMYEDTKKLLDYGLQNFKTTTLTENGPFKFEDKTFRLLQPVAITEPVNDKVQYVVTENGLLNIRIGENKTLQLVPLTPEEQVSEPQPVSEKSFGGGDSPINMSIFLGSILVILIAGVMFTFVKRKISI